jgi:2-phosphoglycerate kinase
LNSSEQHHAAASPSAIAGESTTASSISSSVASKTLVLPLLFGPTALPSDSCVVLLSSAFHSLVHAAILRCIKNSNVYHQQLYGMCREITEQRRSLIILLAGTSGTGKSTLASLLAERLKIHTVLSTDSIRHTLRGSHSKEAFPHLHVSTYETDQIYSSSSSAWLGGSSSSVSLAGSVASASAGSAATPSSSDAPSTPLDEAASWSLKKKVLHGYKSQAHLVLQHLTALLQNCAEQRQTIIIEGVHLLPKTIVQYMLTIPGCIPFFIFISNESKHRERFAVRGREGRVSMEEKANKYIQSFNNIRMIQKYLVSKAEKLLLPCIDNTNVDRSVAAIHSVLIRCMRHLSAGQSLFDEASGRARLMQEELRQQQQDAWSSKRMREVIRMKAEKRILFQRLFAQSQQQATTATAAEEAPTAADIILGSTPSQSTLPHHLLLSPLLVAASTRTRSDEEQLALEAARTRSDGLLDPMLSGSFLSVSPLTRSGTDDHHPNLALDNSSALFEAASAQRDPSSLTRNDASPESRFRSISVSRSVTRRPSVSVSRGPGEEGEPGLGVDGLGANSPSIQGRSVLAQFPLVAVDSFSRGLTTAESTPVQVHSPAPTSLRASALQLPASALARTAGTGFSAATAARRHAHHAHFSHSKAAHLASSAPRTLAAEEEVDSEEDTPVESSSSSAESGSSTEEEEDESGSRAPSSTRGRSRRRRVRTRTADAASHITPSLYSHASASQEGDLDGEDAATMVDDDEHDERDLNMPLLQEEEEEEDEDEETEDAHQHDEHIASAPASSASNAAASNSQLVVVR